MRFKLLVLIAFLIPNISFGAFAVPWNATSATTGWIAPNLVNGTIQGLIVSASSTISALTVRNGTTTNATSTNLNISGTLDVDGLTSALLLTGSTGIVAEYTGTSCTNQFPRSLSVLGVATCETVANTDLANSSVTVTAGTGLTGGGTVSLGGSIALNGWSTTSESYFANLTKDWSVQGNGYLAPTTTRGIIVNASSTIGDGAVATGLTINGGATSTRFKVQYDNNDQTVAGLTINSTVVGATAQAVIGLHTNNTLRGDLRADGSGNLGLDSSGTGGLDINYNSGTGSFVYWGGTTVAKATFGNTGNLTLAGSLSAVNGTLTGNAQIAGTVGIATSSPWARLSVGTHNLAVNSPSFVIASSSTGLGTTTQFIVVNGNVAIGTSTPLLATTTIESSSALTNLFLTGSVNNYLQANLQNRSNGTSASGNWCTTSNIGNNSYTSPNYFSCFGINSSTFSNSSYAYQLANDSFIESSDSNLILTTGTTSPTRGNIKFITGGFNKFPSMIITPTSQVGIGSSTPWAVLSVSPTSTTGTLPLLAVASSSVSVATTTHFIIDRYGNIGVGTTSPFTSLSIGSGNGSSTRAILVAEHQPATSTSMTIDWRNGNTQLLRMGQSSFTIAHTGYSPGQRLVVEVCNPRYSVAGTLTWSGVIWMGTSPTQTTTAQKCQDWAFQASAGTSTPIVKGFDNAPVTN